MIKLIHVKINSLFIKNLFFFPGNQQVMFLRENELALVNRKDTEKNV